MYIVNNVDGVPQFAPFTEHQFKALQRENAQLYAQLTWFKQAAFNRDMPPSDRIVCLATVDVHPEVMSGNITPIEVNRIARRAGVSDDSAGRAFDSMNEAKYIGYASPVKEGGGRGSVLQASETFLHEPHLMQTKNSHLRKGERDAKKERDARARQIHCPTCGPDEDIVVGVHPYCKTCKRELLPDIVPVERIVIFEEEKKAVDQEPVTEPIQVAPPPVRTPVMKRVSLIRMPHCQGLRCAMGPNRTRSRLGGYYCDSHQGFIDEQGRPA
jgi:hypothetical protein